MDGQFLRISSSGGDGKIGTIEELMVDGLGDGEYIYELKSVSSLMLVENHIGKLDRPLTKEEKKIQEKQRYADDLRYRILYGD